jgi:chromosome partitioning protein
MNVITLASRKGGAGKSTLTAHLAGYAHALGHRTLVIDADPQGSLTLWHAHRRNGEPRLQSASRGVERAVAYAMVEGYEWVFIDTAPTMWLVVQEAIRAATLVVVPARPAFFDLNSVLDTVKTARTLNKPYAVVLNAAPSKRDDKEAPVVAQSRGFLDRHEVPVWHGQISQRGSYALLLAAGASACEAAPETLAAAEIASLWRSIERSVAAINAAHAGAVTASATAANASAHAAGATTANAGPAASHADYAA